MLGRPLRRRGLPERRPRGSSRRSADFCRASAEVLGTGHRGSGGPGQGRPLEEKIGVLAQETEAQKAAAEGYRGEVARLGALLAEKDLALNQAQTDLSGALSEVARWHQSSAEHEKRAEGKTCALYPGLLYTF